MNRLTRREFGRMAIAGTSIVSAVSAWKDAANRSLIGGVQFGLQPFCYHDLAMTPDNRPTLVKRLVQNGFGMSCGISDSAIAMNTIVGCRVSSSRK